MLQKTFIVDYLTHKVKKNEGEKESYFVTGSHPAIVSQEIWDMAQFEFEKRSRDGNYKPTKTCFSGKLYCADCGGMYGSKVWHSNDKYRSVVWRCNKKYENKKKCETAVIDEDTIKAGFLSVFNSLINTSIGVKYCMNDIDFYAEMLDGFAADCAGRIKKIVSAFDSSDMEKYRVCVHALKSAAKTIGAEELSEAAKALENAAKNDDSEYIKAHHRELITKINTVVNAILALSNKD